MGRKARPLLTATIKLLVMLSCCFGCTDNLGIAKGKSQLIEEAKHYFLQKYPYEIPTGQPKVHLQRYENKGLRKIFKKVTFYKIYGDFSIPAAVIIGGIAIHTSNIFIIPDQFNSLVDFEAIKVRCKEDCIALMIAYFDLHNPLGENIILNSEKDIPGLKRIPGFKIQASVFQKQENRFVFHLFSWHEYGGGIFEFYGSIETNGIINIAKKKKKGERYGNFFLGK